MEWLKDKEDKARDQRQHPVGVVIINGMVEGQARQGTRSVTTPCWCSRNERNG